MPGIDEKKTEIAGAICAPPTPSDNNLPTNQQPRHPTNLQGLLRFCMDATKAEDAPNEFNFAPMDEGRRKRLEDAIKSIIEADDDDSEDETAIETILHHVDHIGIPGDFHKIGGFMVLDPCLESLNAKIRALGCELLAVLCQHDPYCQKVTLHNGFVPKLISMIEKDEDGEVVVKALYALSAIVRHSQEGYSQMIHYNGPSILLKAMDDKDRRVDDRFITKAVFLLGSICSTQSDFKSRLVFLDYIPTLISLITRERQPSHEHVLGLLATLVEDNTSAVGECRNPRHNLQQVLQKYIETSLEEIQHCKRILYLVFGYNQ